jgi:hypothetical protein
LFHQLSSSIAHHQHSSTAAMAGGIGSRGGRLGWPPGRGIQSSICMQQWRNEMQEDLASSTPNARVVSGPVESRDASSPLANPNG